MCGRYALTLTFAEIAALFGASDPNSGRWDWQPHFNLAPTVTAPVIALNGAGIRTLVPMRWGLHPHWSKSMPQGRPMFNARVETAAEKPSFRTPMRRRRALIPASGWYEWEGEEKPKTPYYIFEKNAERTAFAGLWDQYHVDEGITLLSFTILTTSANGPIKHLHHRMPVRLPENQWSAWLDPNANPAAILDTQKTGDDLGYFEVSKAVNSGRANGPELVQKLV